VFLISDLCSLTDTYLEPDQVKEIYRAYLFGAEAHEGQQRASGEPYINHPIQVARILAEMRLDHQTIVAAILHDVIEDTETAKAQIQEAFGGDVADLVDGVSKLGHVSFESRAEAQAEYFRKMLMAMARDIRVILVKLADRLHNMRTIGHLRPEKRRRIARETLDIYAPIAERLGLNGIRQELEDLGFKALYPDRYRVLGAEMKKARGHRKQAIRKIETAIKRRLRQEGVKARVVGREKHLYSLYRKMQEKDLSFHDIMDVHAFRILVDNADTCYRVLGLTHGLYKPVPGRFKDYIALPKANGYQSLHTVLFGPFGAPIEVQIRSEDMEAVAESGIAAHWLYKSGEAGSNTAQKRARAWLTELLEMQKQAGDSIEFLETVKVDLFPKEVYVFTPAGDIMQLPRGATPVDLAYSVHTDVGNRCIAAKVDGRYVPLSAPLATGQNVEVVTAPWGRAELRRHQQGPLQHPQLPQEPALGGGGGAGTPAAHPGAGGGLHGHRGPGAGAGSPSAGRARPAERGRAARGARPRQAHRAAGCAAPGARAGAGRRRRHRHRGARLRAARLHPRHRGDGGELRALLPPHPR
jgi:RelA/SpoT family (p)ppGpp synthetase